MSIAININSGEDRPFAIDIEGFPTIVTVPKAPAGSFLWPFVLILPVVLIIILGVTVAIVLIVPLALFFVWALMRRRRPDILRFEKERVKITEAGLLQDVNWEARYTEFTGVVLRKRRAQSGRTKTNYQIIELKHSDPQKNLPLFVEKSGKAPEKRWRAYAELFGIAPTREET